MISTAAVTTNAISASSTTNSLVFSTFVELHAQFDRREHDHQRRHSGKLRRRKAINHDRRQRIAGSRAVATELNVSNLSNGILVIGAAILDNGIGARRPLLFSGGAYRNARADEPRQFVTVG